MSWDWEKLKEQQRNQSGKPPQIDDFMKKLNGMKMSKGPIFIILLLVAALVLSTMVYTVEIEAVGIVRQFGKYVRTEKPGLHFKLPAGIEKVTPVKVDRIQREEFGFTSTRSGSGKRQPSEMSNRNVALMLTGDLNVALVPWIVQYKIKEPVNYLFKVQNVRQLLRDMSESAMRLVVGDRSIDEVISKRDDIAQEARAVLQQEMDKAETGIRIVTIEMKRTNVPGAVQPSFNEVNQAIQEKEKMIYQAKEEYNKAIPAALGEKERVIKAAEGYRLDRINRAEGDAARFTSVYNEYVNARDVTRRRLYLEMLRDLFPKLERKYIIDSDQKNFLPLLNLGKGVGIGK